MITQDEMFDIDSPCQRICITNSRGYCKGCLRNRDERFLWQKMTTPQKRAVIELCKQRRVRVLAKKADDALKSYPDASSAQTDLFETTQSDITDHAPNNDVHKSSDQCPIKEADSHANTPIQSAQKQPKAATAKPSSKATPITDEASIAASNATQDTASNATTVTLTARKPRPKEEEQLDLF